MKKRIKSALLWAWLVVFALLHMLYPMSSGSDAIVAKHTPPIVIGLWLLPLLACIAVSVAADRRKSGKAEAGLRQYREEHVRPLVMASERFGDLSFDHDALANTLELTGGALPPIGCGRVTYITVEGYTGDDGIVMATLERVFDRAGEILDGCVVAVKECYDGEGVTGGDGAPVSEDFIRGDVGISGIAIYIEDDRADVELRGGAQTEFGEHISEHGLTVVIDGATGALECG